jgi:hypothetical protein
VSAPILNSQLEQRTNAHRIVGRGRWFPGSILTNPADTTLLADTGALDPGDYLIAVHGATSVDEAFDVQHRDSANSSNIEAQRRRPLKGDIDWVVPSRVRLAANERIRCIQVGNVTGEVQLSIFVQAVEAGPA